MKTKNKNKIKSANLMTHQVPCSLIECFCYQDRRTSFSRTDERTATMCDNNDHLYGRGLIGQKTATTNGLQLEVRVLVKLHTAQFLLLGDF